MMNKMIDKCSKKLVIYKNHAIINWHINTIQTIKEKKND